MKKINICLLSLLFVTVLGCQSFTGFDFDSDAIVGGGAVAGKDYITGLQQSQKAREYFVKSNANASQKKTVTPGNDQGTGVVWTDDGGIVIPPGCSIEFENKGYCLDPHLPAPGAGHEMQFVRTASLIPEELQGTYRNLLKRSAAGDEDVKNNMQRLVWALRTAGSQDVMATHLTERQREILSECAENGSFEDFVYRQELYGKIVEELKSKFINKIKSSTSVRVGNVVYDAFDLLDPDKGKQKVEAHLQSLISMGLNLPVTQTGFNYGELENGIFTDIKGNGPLSFKAKIANSTSQPYTFYPMNYAAQVGSGGSSVGFYAAANSGMRQRTTMGELEKVKTCDHNWRIINKETGTIMGEEKQSWKDNRAELRKQHKQQLDELRNSLLNEIIHMDNRDKELEYGTMVYMDANNEIMSLPITKGNRDWIILDTDNKTILQRTTLRDGKYYVYDGNKVGRMVDSKWGDYKLHWSISWLSGRTCLPQKSWPVPEVPAGAIPLEIIHLHPEYSTFSPEDLLQADAQGVAITVINEGNWRNDNRWLKYDPDNQSFESSLGYNDIRKLGLNHDAIMEVRNQKYTYECTICGAKR